MILLFGAPGAGKSIQGQILAARHGWRWVSAGQMLRDTHDPAIMSHMATGKLIDNDTTNKLVAKALATAKDIDHVVMDGFPRELSQAQWLVENQPNHGRAISLVVVLEVPMQELLQRLHIRGRPDDDAGSLEERQAIYNDGIRPIIDYFKTQNIRVAHVSGVGTVGEVHDRIESELRACALV